MEHVLLVVQVLLSIALVAIILIQRSDMDGFGLGSGSGMNLLSGRATANLLTRTTAIIATLFIINSLVLSILASRESERSIVTEIKAQESTNQPVEPAPPAVPAAKVTAAPNATTEKKEAPAVPAAQ